MRQMHWNRLSSKATIEFHHGKHLQAYVNNLNNLIPGTKFENSPLEQIVAESDGAIFNNAGQILNHNLYFTQFSPKAAANLKESWRKPSKATWGSFDNFKKEFNATGAGLFGSGWVWLAKDKDGKLSITKRAKRQQPRCTRTGSSPGIRCMGTCLLPGLPEPPSRSSECLMEYR